MAIVPPVPVGAGPYPINTNPSRAGHVESLEATTDHRETRSHQDRAGAHSAQAAYEQHARPEQESKRVVVAADLMTAPVTVISSDRTLAEAWNTMQRRNVRHLPVVSIHGVLVGMLSDRDILRHAPELVLSGNARLAAQRRLGELLSPRLLSSTPLTEIHQIARLMLDESIHAVPILDRDRRPIGILTIHDLLQAIAPHGPLELWT